MSLNALRAVIEARDPKSHYDNGWRFELFLRDLPDNDLQELIENDEPFPHRGLPDDVSSELRLMRRQTQYGKGSFLMQTWFTEEDLVGLQGIYRMRVGKPSRTLNMLQLYALIMREEKQTTTKEVRFVFWKEIVDSLR